MDFAASADGWVKLKESEKRDKYLDLARELWNMRVTLIPIVVFAFGTIAKGLVKGLEDLAVKRTRKDNPGNSIIKIGQNT